MKSRVFHSATIRGVRFDGIIGRGGPAISSKRGWSPLVVCALRNFDPDQVYHGKPLPSGWWVVKYYDEVRLRLVDFSLAEIQHLASEFGIAFLDGEDETGPLDRRRVTMFEASPAWAGVRRWVAEHPKIARKYAEEDDYLPGWLTRGLVQNAMLKWPGGTMQ